MKFAFNPVHAVVGTVAVALVSVSLPGDAQAAGITPSVRSAGNTITAVGGAQIWDFSGVDPDVALTGGAIVSGDLPGQYASPGVGNPYLTVGGASSPAPGAPIAPTANLTFTTKLTHFGVFWGTPDSYNTLNFYNGASLIASFIPGSGALAGLLANGSNADARYVDFFADAGTVFDRVQFVSSQAAFEADNVAYSKVPTPAMLPAIVGLGLAALKRRKLAQQ